MSRYMTIKGFEHMTEQQVFDLVVKKVIKQGKPAYEDGRCVYLTTGGCRCPGGHALDGRKLKSLVKNQWIAGKSWEGLAQGGLVPYIHSSLMSELQSAHDTAERHHGDFVEEFKSLAQGVAQWGSLNTDALEG